MCNLIFLISKVQRNFRNEVCDLVEAQHISAIAEQDFHNKLNFCNSNFTTQCKYRIFCYFRHEKVNKLLKKADIYQYHDQNGTKLYKFNL